MASEPAGGPDGEAPGAQRERPTAPPFFSFEALRQGAQLVFFGSEGERPWFNVFLVFVPLAIISTPLNWPAGATFVLSLLAMLPLAERLGFATEELAEHVNETIAGLMNASMGNAPELIIAIFALKNGLLRVVQISLLGSVLSNLLLVLGTGLLIGGLYNQAQHFKNTTSSTSAGMLLSATTAMLLPTLLNSSGTVVNSGSVLLLSRISALFMLALYMAFLYFQLKTHQHLYEDEEEGGEEAPQIEAAALSTSSVDADAAAGAAEARDGETPAAAATVPAVVLSVTPAAPPAPPMLKPVASDRAADSSSSMNHMRAFDSSPSAGQLSGMGVKRMSSMGLNDGDAATPRMPPAPALIMMPSKKTVKTTPTTVEEQEEQDDEIHLTFWGSIAWLTGITAFVAWVSELLVASIQGAAVTWNLPEAFISCILLPVAGNAAEHASAIIFAVKNRLDICFGIAIGSATQISMFGIPLLVIIGWIIGQPLSLDFQNFEVGTLVITVLIASFVMMDGRSHWMQGTLLLATYGVVATGFGMHVGSGDAVSSS